MNSIQFTQWCENYNSTTPIRRPLIMGIVNATPDSFSDGGKHHSLRKAVDLSLSLINQGADLIDIGGESSQPGAEPVPLNEELRRVIPLIKELREHSDICISIDTTKPEVMKEALLAGASMINDTTALADNEATQIASYFDAPVCLMHMQGNPKTMQLNPEYEDVVHEINFFFEERIKHCTENGIKNSRIILDPGFGFGKTPEHNLRVINKLRCFQKYNRPILIGVSRKSTLGILLNKSVSERLIGGLAMAIFSFLQGVAMVRTHDVDETYQAFRVLEAISSESLSPI